MALSLVTAPATEPLTLDEALSHLKVDAGDENDLVGTLIGAAREFCENFTHRAFITQTWDLKDAGFPCSGDPIWIPKPPLISVTSITSVDTTGSTTTWSASLYTVDAPAGPKARMGAIVPNYGEIYPATRDVVNAVTVRFVAGYGAAAAVPASLKAAMKLLIGHWWLNREGAVLNQASPSMVPIGVDALLWPFKSF